MAPTATYAFCYVMFRPRTTNLFWSFALSNHSSDSTSLKRRRLHFATPLNGSTDFRCGNFSFFLNSTVLLLTLLTHSYACGVHNSCCATRSSRGGGGVISDSQQEAAAYMATGKRQRLLSTATKTAPPPNRSGAEAFYNGAVGFLLRF